MICLCNDAVWDKSSNATFPTLQYPCKFVLRPCVFRRHFKPFDSTGNYRVSCIIRPPQKEAIRSWRLHKPYPEDEPLFKGAETRLPATALLGIVYVYPCLRFAVLKRLLPASVESSSRSTTFELLSRRHELHEPKLMAASEML